MRNTNIMKLLELQDFPYNLLNFSLIRGIYLGEMFKCKLCCLIGLVKQAI